MKLPSSGRGKREWRPALLSNLSIVPAFLTTSPTETADVRLAQFAAGDLTAFESIFRQYQGEVYVWIIRIVRDRGVAEDLTLETFWRIWKAHARFDPTRSFAAWARRIATNIAISHLKRQVRSRALISDPRGDEPPDPALSREMRDKISRAFGELPAKLQATAVLALVEERPYEEIAAAFEISVNGVKSRVFRAVRILRKKLSKMGIEP